MTIARFPALKTLAALTLFAALSLIIYAALPAGASSHIVDYDLDDDNLIDISNIAQLNVFNLDHNGDGVISTLDQFATERARHIAAFPDAGTLPAPENTSTPRLGCPGVCVGYELVNNLDYDTDGDDVADSNYPAPPSWGYLGILEGNGYTVSNINFVRGTRATLGLFGTLDPGGEVRNLGLINPTATGGSGATLIGPLVGTNRGTITASYVSGGAAHLAAAGWIGGLVAWNRGTITGSYTTAAVTASGTAANVYIGGMVGDQDNAGKIIASYAAGAVTAAGTTNRGGLVGRARGASSTVTDSYCDSTATTLSACIGVYASGSTTGTSTTSTAVNSPQTTAALQSPTGYTGIYANWNLDLNGDTYLDNPWNFGAANEYPTHNAPYVDYDADGDNLIEISTLHQLNAVRHDMDGNGQPAETTTYAAYTLAFPGGHIADTSTPYMGCAAACIGYELAASLDFDADGSGTVTGTDPYPNWIPIGNSGAAGITNYAGQFHGNGYTISNLTITDTPGVRIGLFARLAQNSAIRDVGLIAPSISDSRTGTRVFAGPLLGVINVNSQVSASYARGGSVAIAGNGDAGGLVGFSNGTLRAGWSTAAVNGGANTGAKVGGLLGNASGQSDINASFAAGPVTGSTTDRGGFVGLVSGSPITIANSYCDTTVHATTTACTGRGTPTATGYTTAQLQEPAGYTGIYADWDIDLDGDGEADHPWGFSAGQYPALYTPAQRALWPFASYDSDGDGLTEITTLAQLNVVRYDLDGDGDPETGTAAYYAAFDDLDPVTAGRSGYELMANLDFDTNGDGTVTSTDAYPNWNPIGGTYSARFNGNGHTIANLTIVNTGDNVGLFSILSGSSARIEELGLIDASITGGCWNGGCGALVGRMLNGATIEFTYARGGAAATTRGDSNLGGLVGYSEESSIRRSYATVAVTSQRSFGSLGGLVGTSDEATIRDSWSAGRVAGNSQSAFGDDFDVGGFVGRISGSASQSAIQNNLCDTQGSGKADCIGDHQAPLPDGTFTINGHNTAAFQTPVVYSGIFANWNWDLNADTYPDNPWNFGTTTTYPALNTPAQRQTPVDYDPDGDNLINISNLYQLNAIRHDLAGRGEIATASRVAYANAFPGGHLNAAVTSTNLMGCADACAGYELMADLDFAADGAAVASTDAFPDWTPIGRGHTDGSHPQYTAAFNGNGHTISRLTITTPATHNDRNYSGLFGSLGPDGRIRDVGLINPDITGGGGLVGSFIAGLAARVSPGAAITASYVSGGTITATSIGSVAGGIAGANYGTIRAGYSTAAVDTGANNSVSGGGLVGEAYGASAIIASYAAGPVAGTGNNASIGVLLGAYLSADADATITDSVCDRQVYATTSDCVGFYLSGITQTAANTAAGYTTAQLQTPTTYTGPYANWNLSLDADDFPDQPWNFGTTTEYPTLKTPMARANPPVEDYDTDNDNLIDIRTLHQLNAIRHDLDGSGLPDSTTTYAAYAGAFPGGQLSDTTTPYMGCAAACTGYELMQNLDFAADGAAVTGTDAYPNWTPIGGSYTADFNGNANTITRLTITGDHANAGLFHTLGNGGEIRDVGMLDASIASTAANAKAGILAAIIADGGEVITSYIQAGSVTVSGANAIAGGLAGEIAGEIRAAYTTASVSSGATTGVSIGGLAGEIAAGEVTASYAAGAVAGTGTGANVGGFAGAVTGTSMITDSYCHTAACQPSGAGATPQASGALQWTDGYTGIFANWNLDLNDDNTPDYPWYFGGPTDYPVLNTPMQRTDQRTAAIVTTVDYDANDNGLIDIDSLTKLNAIRHDLDGNGLPNTPNDYAAYLTAFPNGALAPAARMGCPAGNCTGYELTADLDFAADGIAVTSTDAYPNWQSIGDEANPYTAAFEGNTRSITNLTITNRPNAGLFGGLGNGGIIRDLTIRTPNISGATAVGAFAAIMNDGSIISTSYIQGGTVTLTAAGNAGGLAGTLSGTIRASHASTTRITATGGNAGGLAGSITADGEIIASYAAAPVMGATAGGVAGQTVAGATITASYCDATVSGQDDGIGAGPVTADCHPTGALQSPTGYSGLYAAWNLDLNGDNTPDYPWYFGTSAEYPELNNPMQRTEQRTSGDVPPPPLPRAIIPEPPKPYDPAADHPEIYENAEYEITATCETRNIDPETNEPREATITFNLGTYNGPILLALSIWTGSRYMAYETQNIAEPTLNRQGQTATLNIETNPSQTRFRLDGTRNGLRANLVLGYANCQTN